MNPAKVAFVVVVLAFQSACHLTGPEPAKVPEFVPVELTDSVRHVTLSSRLSGDDVPSREVILGGRLARKNYEKDENALLPGIQAAEYFVIRDHAALESLRMHLELPILFSKKSIDFDQQMVVGFVDERQSRVVEVSPKPEEHGVNDYYAYRRVHMHRFIETPEERRLEMTSYPSTTLKPRARKGYQESEDKEAPEKYEGDYTPYFFTILERSDKPHVFFRNSEYVYAENELPLGSGVHHERVSFEGVYSVFIPEGYNEPLPMIVLLHGSTINGDAYLSKYVEMAQRFGFALLATSQRNGYYWQKYYDFGLVFDALARVVARSSIDPERIYAGGSSAGGHTAYSFVLDDAYQYEIEFKALFSLCGRLNPAVKDHVVERSKNLPIFIMSGEQDPLVSLKSVERGKERLEAAGAEITYHVIEDGDHASPKEPDNLIHVFEWLQEVDKRVQRGELPVQE